MHDSSIDGFGSTVGKFLVINSRNISLSGEISTISLESGFILGPVCKQI